MNPQALLLGLSLIDLSGGHSQAVEQYAPKVDMYAQAPVERIVKADTQYQDNARFTPKADTQYQEIARFTPKSDDGGLSVVSNFENRVQVDNARSEQLKNDVEPTTTASIVKNLTKEPSGIQQAMVQSSPDWQNQQLLSLITPTIAVNS